MFDCFDCKNRDLEKESMFPTKDPSYVRCRFELKQVQVHVCSNYQKMTNADRIRQMSDKELAEYMFSQGGCPLKNCPIYKSVEDMETDILKAENCRACWLDYMQEEYKEVIK